MHPPAQSSMTLSSHPPPKRFMALRFSESREGTLPIGSTVARETHGGYLALFSVVGAGVFFITPLAALLPGPWGEGWLDAFVHSCRGDVAPRMRGDDKRRRWHRDGQPSAGHFRGIAHESSRSVCPPRLKTPFTTAVQHDARASARF